MFAVTLNLTTQGNEMQSHSQTSPEPESALQCTPFYRTTTNQCIKHKMLIDQLPVKGFGFFYVLNNSE